MLDVKCRGAMARMEPPGGNGEKREGSLVEGGERSILKFCLLSRTCGSKVTQKGRNSTEWRRKPRYQQDSNPCWNSGVRKGKPEKNQ